MAAPGPATRYWDDAGLMKLIGGLLLAPLAWLIDLQTSYVTVRWACEHGNRAALFLIPAGSLALIALATWMSLSSWQRLKGEAHEDGGAVEDRSYFLALAGVALNAVFALLILLSLAPRVLLTPCE